jgi:hypothetical protein
MIRSVLAALVLIVVPAIALATEPPSAIERELRTLNETVARLAILMERMVVEQETTALQQQLSIVEQRVRTVEEARTDAEQRLRDRLEEREELDAMMETFRKDLDLRAEIGESESRAQIEFAERRIEAIDAEIVDLERRVRDLQAREQESLLARDRIERNLSSRIGTD